MKTAGEQINQFKARVMQLVGTRVLIAIPSGDEMSYFEGVLGYDQDGDRFFLTDTDDEGRTTLLGQFRLTRIRAVADRFLFLELLPAQPTQADSDEIDWPELLVIYRYTGKYS